MKAKGNLQSTPGTAALEIPERPGIPAEALALVDQLRTICESQPKFIVTNPAEVAALLIPDAMLEENEVLWVLCLNTRQRVIDKSILYRGTLNQTAIRCGEFFRKAILLNAAAIIVAHNHPSGDTSPSPEDVAMTRALINAGHLLDIEVIDHLVIGHGSFLSMKAQGLAFGG